MQNLATARSILSLNQGCFTETSAKILCGRIIVCRSFASSTLSRSIRNIGYPMNQSPPQSDNGSTPIYPLTFDPIFQDYVWGGRNLADVLGRDIPDGVVAESWEIAAHPDGSSIVNNGSLAGKSLPEVQALLGKSLVGSQNEAMLEMNRFPLLIKLIGCQSLALGSGSSGRHLWPGQRG